MVGHDCRFYHERRNFNMASTSSRISSSAVQSCSGPAAASSRSGRRVRSAPAPRGGRCDERIVADLVSACSVGSSVSCGRRGPTSRPDTFVSSDDRHASPTGSGCSSGQSSTSAIGYGSSSSQALTRMRRAPTATRRSVLVQRLDLQHLGDGADHGPFVAAAGLSATGDQRLAELGLAVIVGEAVDDHLADSEVRTRGAAGARRGAGRSRAGTSASPACEHATRSSARRQFGQAPDLPGRRPAARRGRPTVAESPVEGDVRRVEDHGELDDVAVGGGQVPGQRLDRMAGRDDRLVAERSGLRHESARDR